MRANLKPRHWLWIILGIIFSAYCVFQARFIVFGPRVWITTPIDGAIVSEPTINIEGEAKNVAFISLNDNQIFTDEKGHWSEKLILSTGTSIMTVRVRDRFGRTLEKSISLTLN